jgi:hypothetical protein
LFDIVGRQDRYGFNLALRANHVLQRGSELDSEAPVSDENKPDHGNSPRCICCTAPKSHHDSRQAKRKGLLWALSDACGNTNRDASHRLKTRKAEKTMHSRPPLLGFEGRRDNR